LSTKRPATIAGPQTTAIFVPAKRSRFSALNEPDHDDYDGDYQENVNETTKGVGSNQSKNPQYYQNRSKCVKHS
jgi:hypothetical protein